PGMAVVIPEAELPLGLVREVGALSSQLSVGIPFRPGAFLQACFVDNLHPLLAVGVPIELLSFRPTVDEMQLGSELVRRLGLPFFPGAVDFAVGIFGFRPLVTVGVPT